MRLAKVKPVKQCSICSALYDAERNTLHEWHHFKNWDNATKFEPWFPKYFDSSYTK